MTENDCTMCLWTPCENRMSGKNLVFKMSPNSWWVQSLCACSLIQRGLFIIYLLGRVEMIFGFWKFSHRCLYWNASISCSFAYICTVLPNPGVGDPNCASLFLDKRSGEQLGSGSIRYLFFYSLRVSNLLQVFRVCVFVVYWLMVMTSLQGVLLCSP